MKKTIIIYLVLLFSCSYLFSQTEGLDLNLPKMVTPEVATMMKYVDHPVNLANGLVTIEIPLYEIVEGEIRIPIVLSYHSSGLKVREVSGRVGLGWDIKMEPSISRKINGIPDERGYLVTTGRPEDNYPYDWKYREKLAAGLNQFDEDPDAFYYKLLGKTGKFYFNRGELKNPTPNAQIVTIPYEPIKIAYAKGVSRFNYFEITDDDGTYYRFGSSLKNSMTPVSKSDIEDIQWKVTEIISPNKTDTVFFNYGYYNQMHSVTWNLTDQIVVEESLEAHRDYPAKDLVGCMNLQWPFITNMNRVNPAYPEINNIEIDLNTSTGQYTGRKDASITHCYSAKYPYATSNTTLTEHNLQVMEGKSFRVEIAGNYEISSINIYNKHTNSLIRSIRFIRSRLNTNYSNKQKLDKLEIYDGTGNLQEKYDFNYYTAALAPTVHDKNLDHWGYYNGNRLSSNQSAVPRQNINARYYRAGTTPVTFTMDIGEAFKDPDLTATKHGMLQSITYPTGRVSSFEYELNKYREYSYSPVTNAGGLRIARISEYDPITSRGFSRIFKYGENEDGAGILKQKITMDYYKFEKIIAHRRGTNITADPFVTKATIYTSNPIPNIFHDGGSTVFYKTVTEYRSQSMYIDQSTGKTVYEYDPPRGSYYNHITGTTMTTETDEWWAGKLLCKTDYRSFMDNGERIMTPVQRTSYQYSRFNIDLKFPYGRIYERIIYRADFSNDDTKKSYICNNNGGGYIHMGGIIYGGSQKLISERTETFDSSDPQRSRPVTEEKTYEYDNPDHMYVTQIKQYNTNGNLENIILKYPQDIVTPNSAEQLVLNRLIADNHLNQVLERKLQIYSQAWTEKIGYEINQTINTPLPKNISKGYNDQLEERAVIHQYNKYGKPVHITQDNSTDIIYIWSYYGRYPIAEVQNATLSQVETAVKNCFGVTSLDDLSSRNFTEADLFTKNTQLRLHNSFENAYITTYTYKPLTGISSITDPSGKTTYYEYDSLGRLKRTFYKEKEANGTEVERNIESYGYNYKNQ